MQRRECFRILSMTWHTIHPGMECGDVGLVICLKML